MKSKNFLNKPYKTNISNISNISFSIEEINSKIINACSCINLSEKEKNEYLKKIRFNYPGLHIFSSFNYDDEFVYSIFSGIKQLNDTYGQKFVDDIINDFKKYLVTEQKNLFGEEFIWNDYKNLLSKVPQNSEYNSKNREKKSNELNNKLYSLYLEKYTELSNGNKEKNSKVNKQNFNLKISIKKGEIEKKEENFNLYQNIQVSIGYIKNELEKEQLNLKNGYVDFMKGGYKNELYNNLSKFKSEIIFSEDKKFATLYNIKEDITSEGKKRLSLIINKRELKGKNIDIDSKFQLKDLKTIFYDNYKPLEDQNSKHITIFTKDLNNNISNIGYDFENYFKLGKIPKNIDIYKNTIETLYIQDFKFIFNEEIDFGECKYCIKNGYLSIYKGNKIEDKIKIFNRKNNFFSKDILSKVRKNKLPLELDLVKKIRKYIDLLTVDGEFFFPIWDDISSDKYIKKVEEYNEIERNIKKGKITKNNKEFINGNYKGVLSKEDFLYEIEDKEGLLVFIDVKNLGVSNIFDYFKNSEKEISGKQNHNYSLGHSGENSTKKIQKSSQSSETKIKTAGADEIVSFFEGVNEPKEIKEKINKIFKKNKEIDLPIRIVAKHKKKEDSAIDVLNESDKKTQKSKQLEIIQDFIGKKIRWANYEIESYAKKLEKDIELFEGFSNILKNYLKNIKRLLNKIVENNELNYDVHLKENIKKLEDFSILSYGDIDFLYVFGKEIPIEHIIDGNGVLIKNSKFIELLKEKKILKEEA